MWTMHSHNVDNALSVRPYMLGKVIAMLGDKEGTRGGGGVGTAVQVETA